MQHFICLFINMQQLLHKSSRSIFHPFFSRIPPINSQNLLYQSKLVDDIHPGSQVPTSKLQTESCKASVNHRRHSSASIKDTQPMTTVLEISFLGGVIEDVDPASPPSISGHL